MKRTIRDDHRHLRLVLNSRLGISGRREEELVLNLGEIVALPKEGRKEGASERTVGRVGDWAAGGALVFPHAEIHVDVRVRRIPDFSPSLPFAPGISRVCFVVVDYDCEIEIIFCIIILCTCLNKKRKKNVEKMKLL